MLNDLIHAPDTRSRMSERSLHGAAIDLAWRRRRTISEPLSLRETVSRASIYALCIAALWAVAFIIFLLSGVHHP